MSKELDGAVMKLVGNKEATMNEAVTCSTAVMLDTLKEKYLADDKTNNQKISDAITKFSAYVVGRESEKLADSWLKMKELLEEPLNNFDKVNGKTYPLKEVFVLVYCASTDDTVYPEGQNDEASKESRLYSLCQTLENMHIEKIRCHQGVRNVLGALLDRVYPGVSLAADLNTYVQSLLAEQIDKILRNGFNRNQLFFNWAESMQMPRELFNFLTKSRQRKMIAGKINEAYAKLTGQKQEETSGSVEAELETLFAVDEEGESPLYYFNAPAQCHKSVRELWQFMHIVKPTDLFKPVKQVITDWVKKSGNWDWCFGSPMVSDFLLCRAVSDALEEYGPFLQKWGKTVLSSEQPDVGGGASKQDDLVGVTSESLQKIQDVLDAFCAMTSTNLQALEEDARAELKLFCDTVLRYQKDQAFGWVSNFFMKFYPSVDFNYYEGSSPAQKSLSALLLEPSYQKKIIVDDEWIMDWPLDAEGRLANITRYKINRVLLTAILVKMDSWTDAFARRLLLVINFLHTDSGWQLWSGLDANSWYLSQLMSMMKSLLIEYNEHAAEPVSNDSFTENCAFWSNEGVESLAKSVKLWPLFLLSHERYDLIRWDNFRDILSQFDKSCVDKVKQSYCELFFEKIFLYLTVEQKNKVVNASYFDLKLDYYRYDRAIASLDQEWRLYIIFKLLPDYRDRLSVFSAVEPRLGELINDAGEAEALSRYIGGLCQGLIADKVCRYKLKDMLDCLDQELCDWVCTSIKPMYTKLFDDISWSTIFHELQDNSLVKTDAVLRAISPKLSSWLKTADDLAAVCSDHSHELKKLVLNACKGGIGELAADRDDEQLLFEAFPEDHQLLRDEINSYRVRNALNEFPDDQKESVLAAALGLKVVLSDNIDLVIHGLIRHSAMGVQILIGHIRNNKQLYFTSWFDYFLGRLRTMDESNQKAVLESFFGGELCIPVSDLTYSFYNDIIAVLRPSNFQVLRHLLSPILAKPILDLLPVSKKQEFLPHVAEKFSDLLSFSEEGSGVLRHELFQLVFTVFAGDDEIFEIFKDHLLPVIARRDKRVRHFFACGMLCNLNEKQQDYIFEKYQSEFEDSYWDQSTLTGLVMPLSESRAVDIFPRIVHKWYGSFSKKKEFYVSLADWLCNLNVWQTKLIFRLIKNRLLSDPEGRKEIFSCLPHLSGPKLVVLQEFSAEMVSVFQCCCRSYGNYINKFSSENFRLILPVMLPYLVVEYAQFQVDGDAFLSNMYSVNDDRRWLILRAIADHYLIGVLGVPEELRSAIHRVMPNTVESYRNFHLIWKLIQTIADKDVCSQLFLHASGTFLSKIDDVIALQRAALLCNYLTDEAILMMLNHGVARFSGINEADRLLVDVLLKLKHIWESDARVQQAAATLIRRSARDFCHFLKMIGKSDQISFIRAFGTPYLALPEKSAEEEVSDQYSVFVNCLKILDDEVNRGNLLELFDFDLTRVARTAYLLRDVSSILSTPQFEKIISTLGGRVIDFLMLDGRSILFHISVSHGALILKSIAGIWSDIDGNVRAWLICDLVRKLYFTEMMKLPQSDDGSISIDGDHYFAAQWLSRTWKEDHEARAFIIDSALRQLRAPVDDPLNPLVEELYTMFKLARDHEDLFSPWVRISLLFSEVYLQFSSVSNNYSSQEQGVRKVKKEQSDFIRDKLAELQNKILTADFQTLLQELESRLKFIDNNFSVRLAVYQGRSSRLAEAIEALKKAIDQVKRLPSLLSVSLLVNQQSAPSSEPTASVMPAVQW